MKYERLTIRQFKNYEDRFSKDTIYTRLQELEDKIERGELVENTVVNYVNMGKSGSKTLIDKALKYDDLKAKIENGTLKEVVRCKDCVYFQPEYVEMENNERRPYTEEEIKNGKFVTMEKGINCGSRCERFRYWEENHFPVWFNENDFCSYGKSKAEAENKLKELKGE